MFTGNAWLVSLLVTLGCLVLVISGRARGNRMKMLLGGLGVAAAMVTAALLAEALF